MKNIFLNSKRFFSNFEIEDLNNRLFRIFDFFFSKMSF